jgi:hypothetical protein
MKNLLLEEAFMFGLSIFLFSKLDHAWWWYPVLILAPDLSMVGYCKPLGAMTYNFVHHKALGQFCVGRNPCQPAFTTTGLILFGHSSMDRVLGRFVFGPFQNTHLA